MSGIAGYLGSQQPPSVLRAMTGRMAHRGPGKESFYEEAPVFMGARWSFQAAAPAADPLSGGGAGAKAANPFAQSTDRKLAIVFAGELFNLAEAGKPLERTNSVSSAAGVVLGLYQAYGVNCVNRLRGEFVFAIHDMQKDLVFIARDPQGARPLYYATTPSGTFVFASEIKALFEYPGVESAPDMRGIDAYLSLGCSPAPDAMFKGVHKLPPGHRITWNPGLHVMVEPYWQWGSFAKPDPVLKSDEDYLERFSGQFGAAVASRKPDCVFLDGSLEAACVAAAMSGASPAVAFCAELPGELGTPNIPPPNAPVLEAAAVARHLKLTPEKVAFGAQDLDKLPELIWALDEPVADIGVLPLYVMARIAGKQLSAGRAPGVALSAAGAAEMLAGTREQEMVLSAHGKPRSYYTALSSAYAWLPQAKLAWRLGFEGRIGPLSKQRLGRVIAALGRENLGRQYLSLRAVLDGKEKHPLYLSQMQPIAEGFSDLFRTPEGWPDAAGSLAAMQSQGLLSEEIFAAAEKTAMFGGIECRFPFADHRLSETLLGLPAHLRRQGALLRQYLNKTQPGLLAAAAKPQAPAGRRSLLAECLAAEPLKGIVATCLSVQSVHRRDLFDDRAVRAILSAAEAGEELCARQVFALVNLELWFRIFVDHEKGWISR
jgi:asparagine synthase (glutamine-hydrolysing)